MNKKQKKNLQRIIIALILVLILKLLPQFPTPVELVLYCIPYLVVGWDVLRKALLGIKNRQPFDECFLMAVATVGAFALGDYVEGCAVIIFYQIGELFQSVAVGKSRQSISSLMDIRPDYANIEGEDGRLEQVDPDDVEIGTVIVVQPGERVPIDGVIVEGASALNTAALTGDAEPVAKAVSAELGLDEYHAGLLPGDKVDQIETLLAAKRPKENLAFVGDGINDAPVLSRADVGIAMGALGSDAAIEAADVVLMDDDPAKIALAMRIARRTLRIVYQNIVFALAIKFACLVLGAIGMASMWTAIFADVGVMVLAVLNATRALYTKDLAKKNEQ